MTRASLVFRSAIAVAALASSSAYAALPTTAPPTRGAPAGNFIQTLQNYAYDIGIFGGLLVATLIFFVVAKNTITTYGLVADGRATMGQLALQATVGALLLVFIIFLMTQAATVL